MAKGCGIKTSILVLGALVLFFLSASSTFALGNFTVLNYGEWRNEPNFKAYVHGLGDGFIYLHSDMFPSNNKFFCLTDPHVKDEDRWLRFDEDMYLRILDKEIKHGNYTSNTFVEKILFMGLMHTFPCKGK